MTEQTTNQRQNTPADLRASLIAATVDVVTGVCWLLDEDGVAREYRGDDTVGVVTWAGREWNTSAAHPAGQAAKKDMMR